MKDFKALLTEFRKIDFSVRKAALATVVKVHGSSYRSPGARMLIIDDGRWVGSISGGCLEGDALRKARNVMRENKPIVVTYDTREDSEQHLGIGLGCHGVIDVLIEPLNSQEEENSILLFEQYLKPSESIVLATIIAGDSFVGDKAVVNSSGLILKNFEQVNVIGTILPDLVNLFETKRSEVKKYTFDLIEIEVFIELVQPTIKLLLFGAGFDARPVCDLAKKIGWEVEVTDECAAHIAPIFFPTADQVKLCDRTFIDREFDITPFTACVLMSHNYTYDKAVLRKLLITDTPYIGILGPKKRLDKMESEFESEEGIILTSADKGRIHAPIGLDTGAETPNEIAISIIAEIQSVFSGRSGGFLKARNGPIHAREDASGQIFKQAYLN